MMSTPPGPIATARGSVVVRVPASSANLGPGFDSIGLACSCRLLKTSPSISMERLRGSVRVKLTVAPSTVNWVPYDRGRIRAEPMAPLAEVTATSTVPSKSRVATEELKTGPLPVFASICFALAR